jgi:hypothetical protein
MPQVGGPFVDPDNRTAGPRVAWKLAGIDLTPGDRVEIRTTELRLPVSVLSEWLPATVVVDEPRWGPTLALDVEVFGTLKRKYIKLGLKLRWPPAGSAGAQK